jgi:arsenate reductase
VVVHCAGSHPADWLDENIPKALGEWDIEVRQAYSKPVTADVLRGCDVIVDHRLRRCMPDPVRQTLT